ncbi:hypothetical protein SynROS8604_00428 [Synechococcus sp. ROS8604]|nr:hypothetical protein SynROS8604_00428 [Synechococcus sp. ROS8604]
MRHCRTYSRPDANYSQQPDQVLGLSEHLDSASKPAQSG